MSIDWEDIREKVKKYNPDIYPIEQFQFGELIGVGVSMEVFQGTWVKDNETLPVALKVHKNFSNQKLQPTVLVTILDELRREILLMSKLKHHPNVVQIYGITFKEFKPVLIVELGIATLEFYLSDKKESGERVKWWDKIHLCMEVLKGVRGLHDAGIVHGDLKGNNILVFKNKQGTLYAKISDFGASSTSKSSRGCIQGTPIFAAPENNPLYYPKLLPWAKLPAQDIYGLGMVAFQIATDGCRPYEDATDAYAAKHLDENLHSLMEMLPPDTHEVFKEIMIKTTRIHPEERASLDDVELLLQKALRKHSWQITMEENVDFRTSILNGQSVSVISEGEIVGENTEISTDVGEDQSAFHSAKARKYSEAGSSYTGGTQRGYNDVLKIIDESDVYAHAKLKNGQAEIHCAAEKGQMEAITTLVERLHVNVNLKAMNGATAMHYAAEEGHTDLIKMLKEKYNADVNAKANNGRCPIHYAAERGHTGTIKALAGERDFEVNGRDNDGLAALLLAAENGHCDVIKLLVVEYNAFLDISDELGKTATHYAASNGHIQVIELLNAYGAKMDLQDMYGCTAMHHAARNGHLEIVELLASKCNANVNAKDKDSWTVLHHAACNNHDEVVRLLAGKLGAIANLENMYGFTAANIAAERGSIEVVLTLASGTFISATTPGIFNPSHQRMRAAMRQLEDHTRNKLDLAKNVRSDCLNESLFWATTGGYADVVQLLVNGYGANVNTVSELGQTTIHHAAKNGRSEVVKMLVNKLGVNVNSKTMDNKSALHYAAEKGHREVVEILAENPSTDVDAEDNDGLTAILLAAKNGHLEVVRVLASPGMVDNINYKCNNGRTALHYAAMNGHLNIIQILTSKPGVSITERDNDGLTAMLLAAENGHCEIIEFLVNVNNATLTAKDREGKAGIHLAASNGHIDVIKLLIIKFCVDVNQEDNYGRRPIHFAARCGHYNTLMILARQFRANVNLKDNDGYSAMHHAACNGHEEIYEALASDLGADVTLRDMYELTAADILQERLKRPPHPLQIAQNLLEEYAIRERLDLAQNRGSYQLEGPLFWAAINGFADVVRLLATRYDAKVDIRDEDFNCAIHHAASRGHTEVIKALVESGVDVNTRGSCRKTAVHFAACNGHFETVEILGILKANLNITDDKDSTALHHAARNGHVNIVEILLSEFGVKVNTLNKQNQTSLHKAALNGHTEVVKVILSRRFEADVNVKDIYKQAAIHLAASNGHIEIIQMLVEHEAIELNSEAEEGEDAVYYAALNGHLNIVEILLKRPQVQANHAMIQAAKKGKIEIIRMLAGNFNTKVDLKDTDGWAAIHHAISNGHVDIVKMLVNEFHADVNAMVMDGSKKCSPRDLAISRKYNSIAEILKSSGGKRTSIFRK